MFSKDTLSMLIIVYSSFFILLLFTSIIFENEPLTYLYDTVIEIDDYLDNKKNETIANMTGDVLVFRVHSLTDEQTKRLCSYGKQAQATGMDFWISIDAQDNVTTTSDKNKLAIYCNKTTYNIHTYTTDELLNSFPALHEVEKCAYKIQWSMHVEPINLWYQHVKNKGHKYNRAWIFEQDVGVSGNFALFLSQFYKYDSDLISPKPKFTTLKWRNGLCHTSKYETITKHVRKINTREMVIRLSAAYMEYLITTSSNGIIGWSEESIPTLCMIGGYKHHIIPNSYIGRYTFNTRVSMRQWNTIMSEFPSTSNRTGRLYHALKF